MVNFGWQPDELIASKKLKIVKQNPFTTWKRNYMTKYSMFGQNTLWKTHTCSEISKENSTKKESVRIAGWVHFIRDKGKLIFIQLRDSSGLCQITLNETSSPKDAFSNAKELSVESVISVEGSIKEDPRAINGAELIPRKISVLSKRLTSTFPSRTKISSSPICWFGSTGEAPAGDNVTRNGSICLCFFF